ncbi:archaeal proteasome endopeptidase complex subunit alpha [Natronosalvus vescus]|uniref:archaeal proteasome endopeptidase complex subunit alpha n=1 Tax=Natronosalvus vescus TaxID=2953881 RepID=UPI0020903E1D|nr:archaeal proteasome endopeptidase complex subunit alpha [Natronosalvus vescus]
MNGNARQQAYDRGHTIFSPDGRLYQVEYARQAVERGAPSVGIRTDDGIVLAARKRIRSPLLEADSIDKIHAVDDHLAIASAGHAADAHRLVDEARLASQRHRLSYDEPIPFEALADAVARHVQEHTHAGGSRPYGAALLVGGIDAAPPTISSEGPTPRLYEVDPSGTRYGWHGVAIGDGSTGCREILESSLPESTSTGEDELPLSIDDVIGVAFDALEAASDEAITVDTAECSLLRTDGERPEHLSSERLAGYLA